MKPEMLTYSLILGAAIIILRVTLNIAITKGRKLQARRFVIYSLLFSLAVFFCILFSFSGVAGDSRFFIGIAMALSMLPPPIIVLIYFIRAKSAVIKKNPVQKIDKVRKELSEESSEELKHRLTLNINSKAKSMINQILEERDKG